MNEKERVALGSVAVGIDAATGWSAALAAQLEVPSINIPWPNSLLIYPGGAIIVDGVMVDVASIRILRKTVLNKADLYGM